MHYITLYCLDLQVAWRSNFCMNYYCVSRRYNFISTCLRKRFWVTPNEKMSLRNIWKKSVRYYLTNILYFPILKNLEKYFSIMCRITIASNIFYICILFICLDSSIFFQSGWYKYAYITQVCLPSCIATWFTCNCPYYLGDIYYYYPKLLQFIPTTVVSDINPDKNML